MTPKELKEALRWVEELNKAEEYLNSVETKFAVLKCLVEDGYRFDAENLAFCDFNESLQKDLRIASEIVSEKADCLVGFIRRLEEREKEKEKENEYD